MKERNSKGQYVSGHSASKPKRGVTISCANCSVDIYTFPSRKTKFCSNACRVKGLSYPHKNSGSFKKGVTFPSRKKQVEKGCLVCKAIFYIKPSHVDKRITCSRLCSAKLRIGKKPWNWVENMKYKEQEQ